MAGDARPTKTIMNCICQSNHHYDQCCGKFHHGELANNAEQLMRSRYSAYVLELADYVLATWHTSTRPATINFDDQPKQKWLGLQIKRFEQQDENHAVVEFVARYSINGRASRLHEVSRFIRELSNDEQLRWFYVDGSFP
jgi:SEC-C motif-containing protein